ncbi:MAG: GatB/GatE catalytic domain-containing protein [Piptocephalis tieghemiana]|nr:MAG: GatB/GatE catalytic domain-containing protein [Piptocephalis tieghemiana]
MELKPIIGLELHVQLSTQTKLFSHPPTFVASRVTVGAAPNQHVSPFDAAYPGTLPTSLALDSEVQRISAFDRKHYSYPDLPAGYQITQKYHPIAKGGSVTLTEHVGLPDPVKVRVDQIQMEQDTGKSLVSITQPGCVDVDLNRAGTALLEIVFLPDLSKAEEAVALVRHLQGLLRSLGVSSVNMEDGSLRCDVNISMQPVNGIIQGLRNGRCEIKNMNSLKQLSQAISYEVKRQRNLLEAGEVVEPETRDFDVKSQQTVVLRSKETSPEYRYMPEPDIPPLHISLDEVNRAKESLPELPLQAFNRLKTVHGLSTQQARSLLDAPGALSYFSTMMKQGSPPRMAYNWYGLIWILSLNECRMMTELMGLLNRHGLFWNQTPIQPERLTGLIQCIETQRITGKSAKKILRMMMDGDEKSAQDIASGLGLLLPPPSSTSSEEEVQRICNGILEANPEKVQEYKKGKKRIMGWMVAQALGQAPQGSLDPRRVSGYLSEALKK